MEMQTNHLAQSEEASLKFIPDRVIIFSELSDEDKEIYLNAACSNCVNIHFDNSGLFIADVRIPEEDFIEQPRMINLNSRHNIDSSNQHVNNKISFQKVSDDSTSNRHQHNQNKSEVSFLSINKNDKISNQKQVIGTPIDVADLHYQSQSSSSLSQQRQLHLSSSTRYKYETPIIRNVIEYKSESAFADNQLLDHLNEDQQAPPYIRSSSSGNTVRGKHSGEETSSVSFNFGIYSSFTGLISDHKNTAKPRARGLPWLMRLIEDLYDERFNHEKNGATKFDSNHSTLLVNINFGVFIYKRLRNTIRLRNIVEQTAWDLLFNIEYYQSQYLVVRIFKRFLIEENTNDLLLFFLYFRSMVAKVLRIGCFRTRWGALDGGRDRKATPVSTTLSLSYFSLTLLYTVLIY